MLKYSTTLIKRTIKGIEHGSMHTFWNIRLNSMCENLEFCEITFETADGIRFAIAISHSMADAYIYKRDGSYIWYGGCNLDKLTYDTYFMWLGDRLDYLYKKGMELEIETA